MKRMFAFTVFELVALVAVVSVLGAAVWMSAQKDMELAERMEMETQARAIGNAVQRQMTVLIAQRREREITQLAQGNPLQWLPAKPPNYLGEVKQPPAKGAALGAWYFDEGRAELVYRVRRGKRFLPDTAGQRQVRFKVELVRDDAEPVGNVVGAVFRPVEPYRWR